MEFSFNSDEHSGFSYSGGSPGDDDLGDDDYGDSDYGDEDFGDDSDFGDEDDDEDYGDDNYGDDDYDDDIDLGEDWEDAFIVVADLESHDPEKEDAIKEAFGANTVIRTPDDTDADIAAKMDKARAATELAAKMPVIPVTAADSASAAAAEEAAARPADEREFNVTFDDIFGYGNIKKTLRRICDMSVNAEKYTRLGVRMPHGIMLYGCPGVGKTMMATAMIHEMRRTTYVLRKVQASSTFMNTVDKVFAEARQTAPAGIRLDDLDRFSERKGYTNEFTAVQAAIDSVQKDDVYIIATVNDIGRLPQSLCRPGRFDKIIEIGLPDIHDAPGIIARFLEGKSVSKDVDAAAVARMMDGYSCAALDSVLNEAGLYAGYEGRTEISMHDILTAALSSVYGLDDAEIISTEEKARIAYHEAGHAVAAMLLNPGSVSIVSVHGGQGRTQGFVQTLREMNESYDTLRRDMITGLAGRAASGIKFSVPETGASDDINKVRRIADRLVSDACASGFGHIRIATRGTDDESNEHKDGRNTECVRMMEESYRQATTLLIHNWDLAERIAAELMEKDTLTCVELDAIYKDYISKAGATAGATAGAQAGATAGATVAAGIETFTDTGTGAAEDIVE